MISSKNLRRYAIAGVINDGIDNTDLPGMVPEFSEVAGKNAAQALRRSFDFEIPMRDLAQLIEQSIDNCDDHFSLADILLKLDTFDPKKRVSL
jgi:hypothetical protein